MNIMRALCKGFPLGLVTLGLICGCGDSNTSSSTNTNAPDLGESAAIDSTGAGSSDALTASIGGFVGGEPAVENGTGPEKGTAEWSLVEIMHLRRTPISTDKTAEEVAKIRAERHHQIVKLALDAITLLLNNPAKQELFNEAVKQLMEAQLELALVDPEEVDELYENRDVICQHAPKTKAAAEASFAVARFTHTRARDFARQEPKWLEEFARQAQSFASEFPEEEARAVSLLYSAGWSCELNGRRDEAIACYTLLRELFPKSPQAQQIVAVCRRLQLEGKAVELAGETLGGGYLSIDKYAGKPVIVVFWSSDNPQCQSVLPKLVEISQKYESRGLALIGINLDDDAKTVESFLADKQWTWPQLFDSNEAKRRWKHDVVKFYGVRTIPLVWLVDGKGIVVNANVDVDHLEEQLQKLFKGRKPAKRQD